ncbi:MAG: cation:proton antiporter domain-containing protein [Devosia sp.]
MASPRGWVVALYIMGGFAAAMLGSRFVIRPLMHFVAHTNVREAFTALALLLVIGAAMVTDHLGLSPAFGAFLGGVLLADIDKPAKAASD